MKHGGPDEAAVGGPCRRYPLLWGPPRSCSSRLRARNEFLVQEALEDVHIASTAASQALLPLLHTKGWLSAAPHAEQLETCDVKAALLYQAFAECHRLKVSCGR